MKVLFAVSNEEISQAIIKKYQKEYKEIISHKNVYYFNAILKEIQKDKSYDRIVISEDLEAFSHTQYDQIDKFIFDKLDSISDEASNLRGSDIPIILICSDRRTKSEQMLVKLFGIGIYNAILGNDRSVDEVCRLIHKPRLKKEAKSYYKIDAEEVTYQSENENDVSEMEIQNILAHYKSLGKDEDRYIESFNNIAAQYNDTQLRIITKFLPLNVRAVLEERSPKYQKIMSFNNKVSDNLRQSKKKEESGTSEKLLKPKNKTITMTKPVVIPSSVNMTGTRKMSKAKTTQPGQMAQRQVVDNNMEMVSERTQNINPTNISNSGNVANSFASINNSGNNLSNNSINTTNDLANMNNVRNTMSNFEEENNLGKVDSVPDMKESVQVKQPVKRGRGRPRKNPVQEQVTEQPVKRGRGRPRKNPIQETKEEEIVLPGMEETGNITSTQDDFNINTSNQVNQNENIEENFLPGLNEENDNNDVILPGFEEENNNDDIMLPGFEEENDDNTMLPGFEEMTSQQENNMMGQMRQNNDLQGQVNMYNNSSKDNYNQYDRQANNDYNTNVYNNYSVANSMNMTRTNNDYVQTIDISSLLTSDKKIVTFVGTSKNGTSFIVNNVAELLSSMGINVAILDTTMNRNSYYIYTKNEESLRNIAANSIEQLSQGVANGIQVNKNLTVFTSLPDERDSISRVDEILETLVKNYSLILIDCDFNTPIGYFKQSLETYLVQSLDILTIQPLTAFLRELKAKNVLEEEKLKVILNKFIKIRGINEKTIIGGMAFYNDPAMSFMTELFDRNMIKYITIPFEEEIYIKYLEGIINCDINLKGYSKTFMQILKALGNMIYPLVSGQGTYKPPTVGGNNNSQMGTFSPSMNDTLNQMKKNF